MARVALFSKVLDWVVDCPKAALEIFPIRKKEKCHQSKVDLLENQREAARRKARKSLLRLNVGRPQGRGRKN